MTVTSTDFDNFRSASVGIFNALTQPSVTLQSSACRLIIRRELIVSDQVVEIFHEVKLF